MTDTGGAIREDVGEAEEGRDDPHDGLFDVVPGCVPSLERVGEVVGTDESRRHLDVEARGEGTGGVAETEDPIADDEAFEAPLVAEHVGEELSALAAPLAVDHVVGRHDRRDAGVDDLLEVREVHLVQRDLVDLDVDLEAGVLHRVAGEVLRAGHDVALQATGEGCAQLADVERVFAVGLLRSAPRRVSEHVDAHGARQRRAGRAQLRTDRFPDSLLEVGVPGRTPGHGDGEAGAVAQHRSARSVGEGDAREAEPLDDSRVEGRPVVAVVLGDEQQPGDPRQVPVEAPEPLLRRHLGDQLPCGLDGRCATVHRCSGIVEGLDGGHGVPVRRRSSSGSRVATGPGGRYGSGMAGAENVPPDYSEVRCPSLRRARERRSSARVDAPSARRGGPLCSNSPGPA